MGPTSGHSCPMKSTFCSRPQTMKRNVECQKSFWKTGENSGQSCRKFFAFEIAIKDKKNPLDQ